MKMLRGLPSLLALAVAVWAQGPGQYPPRTTSPIPRIPGQTNPTGRPRPGPPQPDSRGKRDSPTLVTTTAGILRRAAPNQLVIQADDHRIIWYRLASRIKVQKDGQDADLSEFARGDYLSVDSNSDDDGIMTAVSVNWTKAGTTEDRAEASKDWDLPRIGTVDRKTSTASASSPPREAGDVRPVLRRKNPEPSPDTPKEVTVASPQQEEPDPGPPATVMRPPDAQPDPDDPGKPALRRGVPAARRQTVETSAGVPAVPVKAPKGEAVQPVVPVQVTPLQVTPLQVTPVQVIPVQDDPVIAKAREAAAAYLETLPNYTVQQITTRYQSDRPKQGWQALDVVTADVTYQDGQESYKNIKVGNKSVNKPMNEIEGSRSTGEFSTLLEQLLGSTAARFRAAGQDTLRSRSAWVYSFEVPRELSRWRIEALSELYYPALKGSIWIDKETSRVLRIEQQGRGMPALFPFDTVETSADYQFIRLGTSGPFLLPVEAEVLSCQRGTSVCSRNKIEFRNYRKFGAESNVTFDSPQ